ncbi:hypothetical protein [Bacillus paramobilis]|uniref:hypothetical protein n=1 Tax=Bacillus paramobilis TaxID=2817477 RepID=UPI0032173C72
MKLTLFTISNEQIKEQLSKLQTKVESLESVKEVQDKIIATKDSQISFLNDQIGNILSFVGIITGAVILVFGYVAWLNKQAQNKVKQAESLITQNQQTATIAEEKLVILEEKQKDLTDLANITIENQKIDMLIRQVSITLDLSKNIIDQIFKTADLVKSLEIPVGIHTDLLRLNNRHAAILESYRIISLKFNSDVTKGYKINYDEITEGANNLQINSNDLYRKCISLKNELDWQD